MVKDHQSRPENRSRVCRKRQLRRFGNVNSYSPPRGLVPEVTGPTPWLRPKFLTGKPCGPNTDLMTYRVRTGMKFKLFIFVFYLIIQMLNTTGINRRKQKRSNLKQYIGARGIHDQTSLNDILKGAIQKWRILKIFGNDFYSRCICCSIVSCIWTKFEHNDVQILLKSVLFILYHFITN